jgi:hypothetical protein
MCGIFIRNSPWDKACAPDGALYSAPAGAGGIGSDSAFSTRMIPLPGHFHVIQKYCFDGAVNPCHSNSFLLKKLSSYRDRYSLLLPEQYFVAEQ